MIDLLITAAGIAVQDYGEIIIPTDQIATDVLLQARINGTLYYGQTTFTSASDVGEKITFNTTAPANPVAETVDKPVSKTK